MRRLTFFLLLLCSIVSFNTSASEQDFVFIEFSRSGCYGYCPDYSVKVHKNGDALFEGRYFVKKGGLTKVKLSIKKVNLLNEAIRDLLHDSVPKTHVQGSESCESYRTDDSTMKLTVVKSDSWDTYRYYFGCPKITSMVLLGETIDRIVEADKLVGQWSEESRKAYDSSN